MQIRTLILALFSVTPLAWGACTPDSRGVCVTGLSAIQDNLLGPLIPDGASPWPYGDIMERAAADNLATKALAEAPALGTQLAGTVSWTAGTNTFTTTSNLTGSLSAGTPFCITWVSVDGAGTGRTVLVVGSVTSTTITAQTNIFAPTSSGQNIYLLPAAGPSGFDVYGWIREAPNVTWHYYDVPIALYRLYYRTLNTTYLTQARQFADIVWQWTIDHGYRYVYPRGSSMISQFFRALDGHSERFPYLYLVVQNQVTGFANSAAACPYCDNREAGYGLWGVALGAKTDPDATRHTQYCSWLTTLVPYWNASQQSDGSWGEREYALNTSFADAPKSYSAPIIWQAAPWREAINIKALEAAYESLMDTSAQGCNSPTLAATTLTSITNAITWQRNYGRDSVNRGAFYEVNSQSQDQNTVTGTGTVSITLGSTALVGVGTNFTSTLAAYPFIGIRSPNDPRTVYKRVSCADDTHCTLSAAFNTLGETSNVSGSAYDLAPAASTACNSSASYCFGNTGDRNLTRTECGGMAWLYAQTLNSTYRDWADECTSATLGGPTAGPTSASNIDAANLPCSGPACDGYVNDTAVAVPSCIDTSNVAPCVYGGVLFSNLGKNFGEAFGAPGIDNALGWRLFGLGNGANKKPISGKGVVSGKAVVN